MNQEERLDYLIRELLEESGYQNTPVKNAEKPMLLRSLMNIRMPGNRKREFLTVQDAYLKEACRLKGIVSLNNIPTAAMQYNTENKPADRIALWQGDITRLQVDAIVNAANSQMLGCFIPCHGCIDNAIHSAAGIQLREECAELMTEQGHGEPAGRAKITKAYNLPSKYVIHTVGSIVNGLLLPKHYEQLEACYRSCLELAEEKHLESIAFCCISTGEFHFPNEKAAVTAIRTVMAFLGHTHIKRVVFNVFKDEDMQIYQQHLKNFCQKDNS